MAPLRTLKTLKSFRVDLVAQVKSAQILLVASSLAYTTILSIVPLLAVSFAIFKAFGGLDKLYGTIEPLILENLAEGTSEEVMGFLKTFVQNAHASAIGVTGLVALIFTSMSMLSSAEKAIHRAWQVPLNRSLYHRIATYWLFITLGPLTLAGVVGFATSQNLPITKFFPSGTGGFLLTTFLFFLVYKLVPNTKVKWSSALIPAALAAIVWMLAKVAYGIYTSRFVAYNKIYGSLGAVPIILLWIYIVWVVILSGAALSATLQKQLVK